MNSKNTVCCNYYTTHSIANTANYNCLTLRFPFINTGIRRFYRPVLLLFLFIIVLFLQAKSQDTPVVISIRAIPGLRFDQVRFKVKPLEKVRLSFFNADDMDHNLVIVKPGSRENVVKQAFDLGTEGRDKNFIPETEDVLWHIPITSPDQSNEVVFIAPSTLGAYPYVCTYPGHGFVMYGVMHVTKDDNLPPLENDPGVPPNVREEVQNITSHSHKKSQHPYTPVAPYLYRVYIDGASPAAIVVSLPDSLSYCWDAGTCRLRFAWSGGFVDNTDLWKGKGDAESKIIGQVFFRDKHIFPILTDLSQPSPKVSYKGYRLLENYPEFHYTVNDIEFFELLKPKDDGSGLIRKFTVMNAKQDIWFITHPSDGVKWSSSTGKWEKGKLKLSPAESTQFTLIMTKTK